MYILGSTICNLEAVPPPHQSFAAHTRNLPSLSLLALLLSFSIERVWTIEMIEVNMTVHMYVYWYRSTHLAAHELNAERERERSRECFFRCGFFEDDTRTMNLIMIKKKQFYSQQKHANKGL